MGPNCFPIPTPLTMDNHASSSGAGNHSFAEQAVSVMGSIPRRSLPPITSTNVSSSMAPHNELRQKKQTVPIDATNTRTTGGSSVVNPLNRRLSDPPLDPDEKLPTVERAPIRPKVKHDQATHESHVPSSRVSRDLSSDAQVSLAIRALLACRRALYICVQAVLPMTN